MLLAWIYVPVILVQNFNEVHNKDSNCKQPKRQYKGKMLQLSFLLFAYDMIFSGTGGY